MTIDRDQLHAATDVLVDVLQRAEDAINSKGYGVKASVPLPNGSTLFFKRLKKNWGLCLQKQDGSYYHFKDTSRRERMLIAAALPDLYVAIQVALQQEIEEVTSTIEALEPFVEQLERDSDGNPEQH